MYYYIEPEVSGGIGRNSIIDTSVHPPLVTKLNYEFYGWLGDDLIESFPCFIVSENLKNQLEKSALTGFKFDVVEITKSENFNELYKEKNLPKFYWLKVTGKAGQQDFGIADDFRLVVSENALVTLYKTKIEQASIEEFQ
ncbi:hypothetical protein [Pseudomonas sp. NBRC 100443]|uniref:hypothetical protein n=1 Tax=Pseudomonas sp. NBRC 100443 TaxID=1113665 RepID=UPI0024A0B313|nr:hypothetical protein [Pseudomonas sp. NBRC 100443]GLU40012.1 hypothetical protein Pssp01_41050 [Pseudomonas sp. NBRC 100443]